MSDRIREDTSLRGPERSAELIEEAPVSDRIREDTSLRGPERSAELIEEAR
ncbi:hypothetical protein MWU75_08295 [Ornithinimicrobium sp. F0845]|uniref:hypothetical protein n=1 Tax=Ornithinimicrobium sp. F0845 TaxID=2926412 RepID=UPI001FF69FD3|nr:hypothetical protein [Ornithinimicrobium sp. F0845]MCK0112134.1 hypothetical protein [Ornithinimicrobium sp. F0845]